MKVVFAPTHREKSKIDELIRNLNDFILPLYFTGDESEWYKHSTSVLKVPKNELDWLETAGDAHRIIVALQVLTSLLEMEELPPDNNHFEHIFTQNKWILHQYGIRFPYTYNWFAGRHHPEIGTALQKASNEYLI